ncbi:MAG: DJ-1/PfpI family protein [Gemmatimonadaceae bacterium]
MNRNTVLRVSRYASSIPGAVLLAILSVTPLHLGAQISTGASNGAPTSASAHRTQTAARKPVIAIAGEASGVELTDILVPRATLAESGVAQVIIVAAQTGKFALKPSKMTIDPDMTFAAFDAAFPTGADYVIVPAMVDFENAAVRAWLQLQAARGATIVSICEGARVVAGAGLLQGKRATTHFNALDELTKKYPGTTWVRNTRYVVDDHLISTTGVSASLPVSIYLIDRIAGRHVADSVAQRIGVTSWDTQHNTDAFHLTKWTYTKAAANYLAWWRHDVVAVPVSNGVDEVALALTMDAIPRTMRAKALTWSEAGGTVVSRQGLRISVDRSRASLEHSARQFALPASTVAPASALDSALVQLGAWYGPGASDLIALGMEYAPRRISANREKP